MGRLRTFACLIVGTFVFVFAALYVSDKTYAFVKVKGHDKSWQGSWANKYFGVNIPEEIARLEEENAEENLDEEMAMRRWSIDRICQHLRLNRQRPKVEPKELDHIVVDDKHRLLYCYVAKVASTNWKRIFMILQLNVSHNPLEIPANESHRQNLFRTLDSYGAEDIQYRLRHYLKFMFVRHPFERLLSAFRNKLEKPNAYFRERFGSLIVRRFRPNASAEAAARADDVTFDEFAQYLLDSRTALDGPLNEHWRPVSGLCHPCAVRYDVVGKYEGLYPEAQYVLRRAGLGHLVGFPRINRTTVNTSQLLDGYLANLTKSRVFRLYQMYALDFKMFGYKLPDFEKYADD